MFGDFGNNVIYDALSGVRRMAVDEDPTRQAPSSTDLAEWESGPGADWFAMTRRRSYHR